VSSSEKTLDIVLRGTSDANVRFEDLCNLLRGFGFGERVRGSHHVFFKDGVEEILNLQSRRGRAKPYQVRQVRYVILKYKLGGAFDV